MTTHELARVLLAAPDATARVHVYNGNDWEPRTVTAMVPAQDEAEYMGLTQDQIGQAYISTEE